MEKIETPETSPKMMTIAGKPATVCERSLAFF